jgi:hypothetical protein
VDELAYFGGVIDMDGIGHNDVDAHFRIYVKSLFLEYYATIRTYWTANVNKYP